MTMQECYKAIGGNYEAVLGRLHSEALIQRFTLKFLEDQSYLQLKQALENKNYEDAFRSAHTLKGVCQNLSFDRLYEVSNELTELLRDRTGEKPGIPEAMEKVTEVYEMTIEEIKKDTNGLIFTNLVDTDMLYGHRNNIEGYARALEYFDSKLPEIMSKMKENDMLIITGDNGNEKRTPSTDHSREYTPILVLSLIHISEPTRP